MLVIQLVLSRWSFRIRRLRDRSGHSLRTICASRDSLIRKTRRVAARQVLRERMRQTAILATGGRLYQDPIPCEQVLPRRRTIPRARNPVRRPPVRLHASLIRKYASRLRQLRALASAPLRLWFDCTSLPKRGAFELAKCSYTSVIAIENDSPLPTLNGDGVSDASRTAYLAHTK